MKVLIVDDDIFSIKGLEKGVAWKEDGITQVFQALSAVSARKILVEEEIDIMVCDIEMPNENGIELLQWIREQHLSIIVVFYSCHADFIYAQNAVKLQVLDYVLKPAPYSEIDIVLKKAVEERKKQLATRKEKKFTGKKALALHEKFMRAILDGTIPDNQKDIEKMAGVLGIEIQFGARFYPILHDIKQWNEILETWNKIDVEFSIKNIGREIFAIEGMKEPIIFPVFEKCYLTIIEGYKMEVEQSDICMKCRRFNQGIKRLTGYGINSYVGKQCGIELLQREVQALLDFSRAEGSIEDAVMVCDSRPDKTRENYTVLVDACYQEMLKNDKIRLYDNVLELFSRMDAAHDYSYNQMLEICRQYERVALAALDIKNIDRGLLINDKDYKDKERKASWGPEALRAFIDYTNEIVLDVLNRAGNERNVIAEVKAYIDQHVNEEISREELARMVFLNEDYLSRLFRKREGISITQYITERKIERAKSLLEIPEVSITMAAEGIGISNFPYFSKMFKRETGVSPSDYKKRKQRRE